MPDGQRSGGVETAPAGRLDLSLTASGPSLGSHRVIDFAATAVAANGDEPFVWNDSAERLRDRSEEGFRTLLALLPAESKITRTTERRYGVRVLAEAPGAHVFLEESPARLEVTVTATSPERARTLGRSILDRIPPPPFIASRVNFRVWHRGREGVEWTTKSVHVPTWDDVERNYPPSTRVELAELVGLEPRDEDANTGRLVVWHGDPGTGKTTAIRALTGAWAPWCTPELLMDPEVAFEDPSYLTDVIAHSDGPHEEERSTPRWRLLVAEDADRYVRADSRSRDNPGLDRLLNVADGILGQGTRLLILLTTNSELSHLHPALIRPGRCLAVTGFHRFTAREANEWLDGSGSGSASGGETLAELFALRGDLGRVGAMQDAVHGQYL